MFTRLTGDLKKMQQGIDLMRSFQTDSESPEAAKRIQHHLVRSLVGWLMLSLVHSLVLSFQT